MKRKDFALILVVVVISGFISLLLSNKLIAAPKNRQEKVEVVEAINDTFVKPSNTYFNVNSINPAQTIKIGETNNKQPFNQKP